MPFGSGMGSFIPVYDMFERPQDAVANTYINHAHNDVLELWLETGIFGMALFAAFVVWFALRTIALWRPAPSGAAELDYSLARAATIVIVLLMVHSLAEYPLRTDAMMAIFAFSCALLVDPLVGRQGSGKTMVAATRRKQPAATARTDAAAAAVSNASRPVASDVKTLPQHLQGRWGEGVDWPAEWSKSKEQNSAPAEDKLPNIATRPNDK